MDFIALGMSPRNKRSQFLTKLTVRSRLCNLMWAGKISGHQSSIK